jgi:hypothetical protein
MGNWGRLVAMGMVGLASGCFTITPREPLPVPVEIQGSHAMPQIAKNRVHAVLISGLLDPLSLKGMRSELIDLGFIKTTHGAVGGKLFLQKLLAEIRQKEPDARFVFVGHGTGVPLASELAGQMQASGAAVDAVVGLEPSGSVAPFAGKLVCLSTSGQTLPEAENLKLEATGHGVAADPSTTLLVLRELLASASQVQIPTPVAPAGAPHGATPRYPAVPPELPAPRPAPSEWDFIRPDNTPSAVPTDKPILQAGHKRES